MSKIRGSVHNQTTSRVNTTVQSYLSHFWAGTRTPGMLALLTWVFRSVCRVSRCQWVWWVQEVDEVCGLLSLATLARWRLGRGKRGKLLVAWISRSRVVDDDELGIENDGMLDGWMDDGWWWKHSVCDCGW